MAIVCKLCKLWQKWFHYVNKKNKTTKAKVALYNNKGNSEFETFDDFKYVAISMQLYVVLGFAQFKMAAILATFFQHQENNEYLISNFWCLIMSLFFFFVSFLLYPGAVGTNGDKTQSWQSSVGSFIEGRRSEVWFTVKGSQRIKRGICSFLCLLVFLVRGFALKTSFEESRSMKKKQI